MLQSRIFLAKCELWESNTARAYSLNAETTPLKELILEWRKMEVLCWQDILNQVDHNSFQSAFLGSWPLFESFMDESNASPEYERNLLVLLTQWLTDSSLSDLKARLKAVQLLVDWLKQCNMREWLWTKAGSVVQYFSQFLAPLDARVQPDRSEACESLAALIKVAKYTDLNLWSVKESAQKVHGQICRIVHAYKVS